MFTALVDIRDERMTFLKKSIPAESYLKRLKYALIPAFLLSFIYTLFTPVDVIISNESYFIYSWTDLIGILVCGCALVTLVLACLTALTRGELFDKLVLFIVGLSVASYVQYMFLNPDFGVLDGSAIQWHTYTKASLVNFVLWAGIIVALFVFRIIADRNTVRMVSTLICVVLIAAQGAGMVSLMLGSKPKSDVYLSAEDRYLVSGQDNVIVFCLDNVSNELFEDIVREYPDVEEGFRDFTYYNNANCNGRVTFPAMEQWLTGVLYDGSISVGDYFRKAWSDKQTQAFYAKLREKNFKVNLYVPEYTVTDDINYLQGIADNIGKREIARIDIRQFMSLYKLSAFRSFPLMMKATMWVSTDDIQGIVRKTGTNWIKEDHRFIADFRENGLNTDSEKNYYIVQYMKGAHVPYNSDENGFYAEKGTDEIRQTTGYLRMVIEYVEQLKILGVYDRATIIVTADHGALDRLQFAYLIKKPGEQHEAMLTTNAPISPQIQHFGTIMTLLGERGFGDSIFDYEENQIVERVCTFTEKRDDYPQVRKYGTTAEGAYNTLYAIRYSGDRCTLAEQAKNPDEILPMVDSFW